MPASFWHLVRLPLFTLLDQQSGVERRLPPGKLHLQAGSLPGRAVNHHWDRYLCGRGRSAHCLPVQEPSLVVLLTWMVSSGTGAVTITQEASSQVWVSLTTWKKICHPSTDCFWMSGAWNLSTVLFQRILFSRNLFLISFWVAGAVEMFWNHTDVLDYWKKGSGSGFHHILTSLYMFPAICGNRVIKTNSTEHQENNKYRN